MSHMQSQFPGQIHWTNVWDYARSSCPIDLDCPLKNFVYLYDLMFAISKIGCGSQCNIFVIDQTLFFHLEPFLKDFCAQQMKSSADLNHVVWWYIDELSNCELYSASTTSQEPTAESWHPSVIFPSGKPISLVWPVQASLFENHIYSRLGRGNIQRIL